ncbi:MAG TPA: OmpH family outer membrane protein [Ignavibacteria bacterium]|nr:OmpH family outer membrane protein [Ignavibacteria bacterium]HMQ99194.1 OmpH family outer membrane protein [Ignavibacteria bacterium]
MKNILIALFLFAVVAASANSQVKIAFVDSEVIIAQLPEAQEVKKKLEDLQKLYIDTITTKENDIKTKADAFKAKYEDAQKQIEAGKLNADQIKSLEGELGMMQEEVQALDQELSLYKQNIQKQLYDVQVELFKPVKEKITKSIETLAKELKYNIVLDKASDALIYGDKDIDITFKVLDKLK